MGMALAHAGLAILVALVGFILNRRSRQIHVLVNSRMQDSLDRIKVLESLIHATPGIEVPPPTIRQETP